MAWGAGVTLPLCIVDTREQQPLEPWVLVKGVRTLLPTERRKLHVGDYAPDGLEAFCAIERKSLADLYGTLFGTGVSESSGEAMPNQDRFRAELLRGLAIPRLYLLVESSWVGFERYLRDNRRRVTPATALGLITSLDVLYGVRVIWAEDRSRAAWFVGFVLTYLHEQATDIKAADKARLRGVDLPWLRKEGA